MRGALIAFFFVLAGCGTTGGADAGQNACLGTPKSPANVLSDPGFDCGTDTWKAASSYGEFKIVEGGITGKAGQITFKGELGARFGALGVIADGQGKTWCAQAMVKGSAKVIDLLLVPSAGGQGVSFSAPLTSSWSKVRPSGGLDLVVPAGASADLLFRVQTSGPNAAAVGDSVLVDDVDVWASATGRCDDAR